MLPVTLEMVHVILPEKIFMLIKQKLNHNKQKIALIFTTNSLKNEINTTF